MSSGSVKKQKGSNSRQMVGKQIGQKLQKNNGSDDFFGKESSVKGLE